MNGAPAYTPEEMGADVDQDGNVITVEAEDIVIQKQAITEPVTVEEQQVTVEEQLEIVEAEAEAETEKEGFDWSQPVTIESASSLFSKSAGKLYCDLTIGELSQRFNALTKSLVLEDLTDEERAEKEFKKKAAMTLIGAKKDGSMK